MTLQDFKLVKNKQRPEFCYEYVLYLNKDEAKLSIFTMNGGHDFLASITGQDNFGKLTDPVYSKTVKTANAAIEIFQKFISEKK